MALVEMESEQRVGSMPISAQRVLDVMRSYFSLTKPRIMILLLFTQYCAMIVANGGLPNLKVTLYGVIGLALSTGGAAALNMWYDRDIDAVMRRTQSRPIPSGKVSANGALWFGVGLEVLAVLELGVLVNWLSAALALGGFFYYVVIYTMWLKRRTPQNIVIGGGAGAFPPLVGWAAVTGHMSLSAILMFLIIFMWTPPHFWALALYKQDDYRKAQIPMMPVARGALTTKIQSLLYTIVLTASAVALYFTHIVGMVYLVGAIALGVVFSYFTLRSLLEAEPATEFAKKTFKYSLLYLPTVFVLMVLNTHHLH